jgi:pentose-5-phosphate-3-epimerase
MRRNSSKPAPTGFRFIRIPVRIRILSLKRIRELGAKASIAANPDVPLEKVTGCFLDQKKLSILVEADGGIKADNIDRVVRAGAEVIVSGSGIFRTPDYAETMHRMRKAVG